MPNKNYISIDGNGNISLQDINGRDISINDIATIKKEFKKANEKFLKDIALEIDRKFNEFKNANKQQAENLFRTLNEQIITKKIEVKDSENVNFGNISGVDGNLHIGHIYNYFTKDETTEKENIYIDENNKYRCNRFEQTALFENLFSEKKESLLQFYFIHGKPEQLPKVLLNRFFNDFIQDTDNNSVFETIKIPHNNFSYLKTKILNKLFSKFAYEQQYNALNIKEFCNLTEIRDKKNIVINFEIESRFWDNSSLFLKYFIHDFLKDFSKYKKQTSFIFFWSIIYKDDIKEELFLKKWLRISKKDKILQLVRKLKPDKLLPELNNVTKDDIETWLDEIEEQSKAGISKLYNEIDKEYSLKNKNEYTMREVIDMFNTLIGKYKTSKK